MKDKFFKCKWQKAFHSCIRGFQVLMVHVSHSLFFFVINTWSAIINEVLFWKQGLVCLMLLIYMAIIVFPCFFWLWQVGIDCRNIWKKWIWEQFSNEPYLSSSHVWFSYIYSYWLITSQVYYEPTQWLAFGWLVGSVGRALHHDHRGHGFKSCTGLNLFFFSVFSVFNTTLVVFITAKITFIYIS